MVLDNTRIGCSRLVVRTTLTLDDETLALLRREMRRTGKSFKEVINVAELLELAD